MLRDALLVAAKDLRLELRSRVGINQVLPFGLLVLLLFGFALDPDSAVLNSAAPGLFWLAVLFTATLAIQRAFAVEIADDNRDALRLSGLDPAGIFLGKAAAIAVQMLLVELVHRVPHRVVHQALRLQFRRLHLMGCLLHRLQLRLHSRFP